MNAENFPDIIRDTSRLYQLTYEELKSLVVQYPYCQNLLLLLLKKGYLEDHPDWERTLNLVATSIPNRTKLYHWIKAHPKEAILEEQMEWSEEILELKDLKSLGLEGTSEWSPPQTEEEAAEEATAPPDSEQEVDASTSEEPVDADLEALFDFSEETRDPSPALSDLEAPVLRTQTASPPYDLDRIVQDITAGLRGVDSLVKSTTMKSTPKPRQRPRPTPKTSFSSWLKQFQSPQVQLNLENLMETHVVVPPPAGKAEALAQTSVEESGEVVTETLALLLEKQGHTERAIEMYQKLRLIFPEKSGFFAEKIKNLSK